MGQQFNGANLRLARVFHGLSLDDLAGQVKKSRQFLHKLETNSTVEPTADLAADLALHLRVATGFFYRPAPAVLPEESVHFRKLFTTRSAIKQAAMAKAEMFLQLVDYLDEHLKLPAVSIPTVADINSADDIEQAAELCRRHWELGLGPIDNMVRVAERAGAVVTTFNSVSAEVDALSYALKRPVIVRNDAKPSACRQRFDIAHELGHFVLHQGLQTGNRTTESQANRFASAFLLPRSMMAAHWPKAKGSRLDWLGMRTFKLTWKVSKAAMLYRARQLDLIDDAQYKSGVITLRRTGEAITEREDNQIPLERPNMVSQALEILCNKARKTPDGLAEELGWSVALLEEVVGSRLIPSSPDRPSGHVVSLSAYRKRA
ncbi:MAG: XRE family transcriptional regulator [Rhodocyclaceae bacterium]|nr:XRE family transcriptional regulator [Rhodocyclaceae bacterium]